MPAKELMFLMRNAKENENDKQILLICNQTTTNKSSIKPFQ